MARIQTYNIDPIIDGSDKLVGTDGTIGPDLNKTKNFTVGDILNFVTANLPPSPLPPTPTLQQVTTAGPTATNGITITTNANLAVPIKGIVDWEGVGGQNNVAVYGQIRGNGAISGIGVKGFSPSGTGVYGESSESYGVHGQGGSTGVYATGSVNGVFGQGETGVRGEGAEYGVYGKSITLNGSGVYGEATYAPGVFGWSASGYGGRFYSDNVEAIYCDGLMYAANNITTAGNFIKLNGTPTQSLMANGTTRNISIFNNSTAPQVIPAAIVTYLTNSDISTANIKAGSIVTWNIAVVKTAAGVTAPIFTVRFGASGTTADATLLTFTGSAQTAAADGGLYSIVCTFKNVGIGTTATLAGYYTLIHNSGAAGLSTAIVNYAFSTSGGFDSTIPNAVLGITVNSGAAAAWTINQVGVKLENQA